MASVYYSANSTASSPDGQTKATAYKDLQSALNAAGAGGTVWGDNTSNETLSATTTITSPGTTPAGRVNVLSVNFSGSTPPAAADFVAGLKITTGAGFGLTLTGYGYAEGLAIVLGSGSTGAGFTLGSSLNSGWRFGVGCTQALNSTSTSSNFNLGNGAAYNHRAVFAGSSTDQTPQWKFGASGQTIYLNTLLYIRNKVAIDTTGSVPAALLSLNSSKGSIVDAEAVDFTGAGATLINVVGNVLNQAAVMASFRDCLIPASVTTLVGGNFIPAGSRVSFVRCSTGAGVYENRVIAYEGWQTDETSITRQGGATDNTTLRSWRLSTVNGTGVPSLAGSSIVFGANWVSPFEAQPIFIWNDQTGSALTVYLEGIWGSSTVPNNDDLWIEVEALTASGTSLGITASGTKASAGATGTALSTSSATWNNPPSTSSTFRLSATITPQQKGWLKITPKVARAASDFYIDPKPVVSGGSIVSRSYSTPSGAMVHETGATTPGPTVYVPFDDGSSAFA